MTAADAMPDLSGLERDDWFMRLDAWGEDEGHFERLGPAHADLFLDAGRTLLVTFETVEEIRRRADARPRGAEFCARLGWSLRAFISDGDTWFRDPAVWGTFDRLTDDGFFEDFERVLFFGIGACGYAAAALSVAAPGARVLAIRPQATLTPAIAGWDRRFPRTRRMDFTSRYAYGPDMIDAAEHVDIVVDPSVVPDAIHAALFTRANVTVHRTTWAGPRPEAALDQMDLGAALIEAAMAGGLTGVGFARLWRARRDNPAYLRMLVRRLEAQGRPGFAHRVCLRGLTTRDRAHFARKIEELAAMADAG
ncbi:MAG: hypothetical protein IT542_09215 [Rubellimicrobium sp.]|nr:hypothetical protein [Rubellimicrobium sp.]